MQDATTGCQLRPGVEPQPEEADAVFVLSHQDGSRAEWGNKNPRSAASAACSKRKRGHLWKLIVTDETPVAATTGG